MYQPKSKVLGAGSKTPSLNQTRKKERKKETPEQTNILVIIHTAIIQIVPHTAIIVPHTAIIQIVPYAAITLFMVGHHIQPTSIVFVNISFVPISIVLSLESFRTSTCTFSVKFTIIWRFFDAMNTLVVTTEVFFILERCR